MTIMLTSEILLFALRLVAASLETLQANVIACRARLKLLHRAREGVKRGEQAETDAALAAEAAEKRIADCELNIQALKSRAYETVLEVFGTSQIHAGQQTALSQHTFEHIVHGLRPSTTYQVQFFG